VIGRPKSQPSILNSAFNTRRKRSCLDKLLEPIDEFLNWMQLEKEIEPLDGPYRQGCPTVPIIYSLMLLFLQYIYDWSDL